jgi:hypothetical protein
MASTCSVSPASSPMDGSNVATTTVSLTTTAHSGAGLVGKFRFAPPLLPRQFLPIFIAWLLVLLILHKLRRTERSRRLLTAAAVLVLVAVCASCGGGTSTGSPPPPTGGTPAGTYTITVTGTSGSLSHSATFKLIVN